MSFVIERRDYTSIATMATAIVEDMIANGFNLLYPVSFTSGSTKTAILQANTEADPLFATEPWAIKISWEKDARNTAINETTTGGYLEVIVATPTQFNLSTGAHAIYAATAGTGDVNEAVGVLGTSLARTGSSTDYPDRIFIDRSKLTKTGDVDMTLAFPMSYHLTITARGIALFVWRQNVDDLGNKFSWFVVQRPVDNVTGVTVVTGKTPVHCLYNLMSINENEPWTDEVNYKFNRFVVREKDIVVPYPQNRASTTRYGVDATIDTIDYAAVVNARQQVAITENNKYVISFPNGLNTSRYAYTYEMDMIAYTSADVVSKSSVVPITVYGELTPRKYKAMMANGPNNTGMRILVLVEGGGIPAP